MRSIVTVLVAIVSICSLSTTQTGFADDQTGGARVKASLDQLDRWLGDGEKGAGWRRFLESDKLLQELDKGTNADRKAVREILDRYSSDTKGLELRRFAAVRAALEQWLQELPLVTIDGLPQAAPFRSNSVESFRLSV